MQYGYNWKYMSFHVNMSQTNTIKEMIYDNVINIIYDVNLNVRDDKKITLWLSDHRIMKLTANFII